MAIRIFVTGGTFDKEYDEINGRLYFQDTHLPDMLEMGRCRLEVDIRTLMMIDSLDMTDGDREIIARHCRDVPESRIIVTHGTDTMTDTAAVLAEIVPEKTVVLTGAMIPIAFGSSDGLFNLGGALTAVQVLGPGVYIVMNGRVYYGTSHAAGELRGYRWTSRDADQLGVPVDRATFEEITRELLRNLGVIASALDPGRIVLGGDLAGRGDLVASELSGALRDTSLAPLHARGVLRTAGADEYPVSRGAARMVLQELFSLPAVESGADRRLSWPAILVNCHES